MGLRALQQKAEILRRLARYKAGEAPAAEAVVLAEADQVTAFAERMLSVIAGAPPGVDLSDAAATEAGERGGE